MHKTFRTILAAGALVAGLTSAPAEARDHTGQIILGLLAGAVLVSAVQPSMPLPQPLPPQPAYVPPQIVGYTAYGQPIYAIPPVALPPVPLPCYVAGYPHGYCPPTRRY